jgi:hypothetical protein
MPTFRNTLCVPSSQAPIKIEQPQCSETLAFKLQTPGNHPEGSKRHSKHGEILKSRITGNANALWNNANFFSRQVM